MQVVVKGLVDGEFEAVEGVGGGVVDVALLAELKADL
jgi:hypothetical protein